MVLLYSVRCCNKNRCESFSLYFSGEKDIDTYEVNDHVWFEAYVKEQPIHDLFWRDSQYHEGTISNDVNS